MNLTPHFELRDKKLFYNQKLCVSRKSVKDILELPHDSSISGHFGFDKTLERLHNYHWKSERRDVHEYCSGFQNCQTAEDGQHKKLGDPRPLELLSRR